MEAMKPLINCKALGATGETVRAL
ncbi:hypothetical protein Q4R04_18115 [Morganella morganii]